MTAQPSSSLAYGTQFSAGSISCPGIGSVVCTVAVTFAPTQPGLMQDAVLVKDASGNLLRTIEVYGVGQASRVNLIPGSTSALASVSTHLTGGMAVDAQGNVYFTQDTNTVLKQTPSGTVTVVAGGGTNASATYSGSPTGVQLAQPAGLAIDGAGNLYIADSNNYVVRMIDSASGTLITVAGNGTSGYSGDGGAATSATLKGPTGVAVDVSGNLYISDYVADVIREVGTSGTISTFAGTGTLGYTGDGGAATNARLNRPTGIAIDSQGNFYIADNRNSAIRKVASGIITTIAGNGTAGFSGDGGAAVNAQLNLPSGMALDSTANLYFNDAGNSRMRSISVTTGNIITVAGGGITPIWTLSVSNQVPSTQVNLYGLTGLAIDPAGNLYAASTSGSLNSMFKVTISSSAMDFSATALNQATAAQSVTLWNSGNATLNITPPIAVGGTNSADFTAQTTCGTSVSAGQTCSTSVTFVTAAAAAQAGTLTFTDNANNAANPAATQVVTLNGTVGTPVHVFIDSPGPLLTPFIGNATFSGWAVGGTTAGVTSVALYIDGAPIGTTTNTISRADVCAVYPAQIGCPLVGWSFSVDTTKLTSGPHQVEAVATSTAGLHGSAVTAFYVANWNAGLDPIHIAIDSPSANASFSGTAYFGGWALDDVAAISNVAIAVDGSAMGNAVFGGNRGDVCTIFTNRLG
ncbi:MAG: choice-of-anchor D domain-containing protein, partial [Acidobacteriaceae bacterium]|nr:choice-of-anchor D domain-containing protein [Acidobacteriaceae bacterium]